MILQQKRHLCLFAVSFVFGTVLYCRKGDVWLPVLAVLGAFLVFGIATGRRRRERRIVAGMVLALIAAACLLCGWQTRSYGQIQEIVETGSGQDLSGTVYKKEIRSDRCLYYLHTPYKKVMVYDDTDEVPIGASVTVRGTWQAFSPATNEGAFDYAEDYREQGISFRVFADSITVERKARLPFREGLYKLQKKISAVFEDSLSAREAGVLAQLTVGNRGLMDPEVRTLYQEAGLSHILAISGLHISILGFGVYRFLRKLRLPHPLCEAVGCGLVLCFVVMSGMGVSSLRALIMYLLLMGSHAFGRTYDSLNALAAAALVLLLPHPMNLYRSGFQFSFLAMAAIVLYSAVRQRAAERIAERRAQEKRQTLLRAEQGDDIPPGRISFSAGKKEKKGEKERGEGLPARIGAELKSRLLFGAFLQMALLPLTAWCYYEVPLYATFLNLVVLPLCSALLGFGLGGGALGIFFPQAAKWLLVPCHFILRFYEEVISLVNRLPFSSWITGRPSAWMMLAFYAALVGVCAVFLLKPKDRFSSFLRKGSPVFPDAVVRIMQSILLFFQTVLHAFTGIVRNVIFSFSSIFHDRKKTPLDNQNQSQKQSQKQGQKQSQKQSRNQKVRADRYKKFLFLVPVLLLFVLLFVPQRSYCRIDFLDVGQGDGIYLTDGEQVHVMIDGGSSTQSSVGQYVLKPFLTYHAIRHMDAWILTHGDADHYSGLLELLEDGYRIDRLVLAAAMPRDETWEELTATAEENGTEVVYVTAGDAIVLSDCTMTCLYPAAEDGGTPASSSASTDANEFSQVWEFTKGSLSVLLTGDIGEDEERLLLDRGLIHDQVVLKVAHHGSKYSSCEEFLSKVSPEYAVISCGENNVYGHPAPETLERLEDAGCEIFKTPQSGQITFYEKRGKWKLRTFVN